MRATWPKPRDFLCASATACLLMGLTGCETSKECSLTYRLWNNGELRRYYEPATNPRLQLFEDRQRRDVLAVYDEAHETRSAIRRRAYYVMQNREQIDARRKPRFVNSERARSLPQVSLDCAGPAAPPENPPLHAVISSNGQQFTLSADFPQGTHQLPVYQDRSGTAARVLLSPFAVAGDVVMVGVVASVLAAYVYAGGYNYPAP